MKAEQGSYKSILLSPEEVDTNAIRYQKIYHEIFREANYIPMHPDVPAKDPAMKAEQGGYKSIVLSPEEVDTNATRYQKIYQEIFR